LNFQFNFLLTIIYQIFQIVTFQSQIIQETVFPPWNNLFWRAPLKKNLVISNNSHKIVVRNLRISKYLKISIYEEKEVFLIIS